MKYNLLSIYHKELYQYNRHSTLMSAYKHINDPKFKHCVIREKGEVYKALTTFFKKEEGIKL
ncbi:hypothetical protein BEP19_04830 [Ammoniphilus oxalaticus]|uniref:Uncharacterized protein n=1 Tax=Ammoniphilus oxalaticus TaxID=66863 RepID=A0A419SIL6_9BACL|nr:hypothetical protein BEP19_04830 [Ammoniphilus oxalaticus]